MGILTNLFCIILILISMLPIMLFIFLEKREKKSIPKDNTIKDYLKEYLNNYNSSKMAELHTKLKLPETLQMSPAIAPVVSIFLIIIMYFFRTFTRENFLAGYLITIIFVFGGLFAVLLTKKPTIKKMVLKNNVVELYYSNDEIKIYQLDRINVKYDIKNNVLTWRRYRYRRRAHKHINVYYNNDKYTSEEFNIYDFKSYIAFVIFINLLKRNELEKINNLNDEDIKRLQQDIEYNEESQIQEIH